MFAYFHDMILFRAIYRKIAYCDFRDLLLEGAIFIVGSQNFFRAIYRKIAIKLVILGICFWKVQFT